MPSRRRLAAAAAALSLALGWPAAARAHGVTDQIERRGDAWAVRVRAHGGKPLVAATYQVMRPGSDDPLEKGKTGADGWVTFTPDERGTWTVRIADAEGHGRVVKVEVKELPAVASPSTATATATATPTPTDAADGPGPLRVVAGAAAILGVFVAAWAVRRHRAAGR